MGNNSLNTDKERKNEIIGKWLFYKLNLKRVCIVGRYMDVSCGDTFEGMVVCIVWRYVDVTFFEKNVSFSDTNLHSFLATETI